MTAEVFSERVPLFASLAVRNYRVYWVGGFVSNVGTWMARVAQDWLVLTVLTDNSATALGAITALQFLPVLLCAPWAGTIADRYPKRQVLLFTQTAMLVTGLLLAVLVLAGHIELWHVFLLAALQGIAQAFDGPARQSFAPEMVPTRLISNAVGLNATSFNGARLIGPGVTGLVIAAWGIGPALVINALSFAGVIAALAVMDPSQLTPAPPSRTKGAIREGIRYVRKRPTILLILFVIFMHGTFGMNFQLTNALMATTAFGVGPEQYGLMGTIMAVGSLAAALLAARRTHIRLRLIVGSLAGFAVSITALALAPDYSWYIILLVPTGLLALTVMTGANAAVQLACEPEMRGRVMALYLAIFMGGTPIGSPLIGWIGDAWGPRWTLAIGGIATGLAVVVCGIYYLRSRAWAPPWRREDGEPILDVPETPR